MRLLMGNALTTEARAGPDLDELDAVLLPRLGDDVGMIPGGAWYLLVDDEGRRNLKLVGQQDYPADDPLGAWWWWRTSATAPVTRLQFAETARR